MIEQHGSVQLGEARARADLSSSLAVAYDAQGAPDKSLAAIAAALQAVPDFAPALILQIRLKAREGDYAGALQMIDALLQREPKLAGGSGA